MAAELVSSATSAKLNETDWTKNIEICELVSRDHRQARDVIKAIKKCMGSKKTNTKVFTVTLLEMLMNNIGEPVHKQVVDTGILPVLVKIAKKKSELAVREKILLLLDAAQSSVGGASGRFPQYYSAYYELVSAGIQFPVSSREIPQPHLQSNRTKNNLPEKEVSDPQLKQLEPQSLANHVSESSVLRKAGTAMEILRDVLNAIDTKHSERAKDEFTLDLVEQCSFQKQQVMHLVVTSRDEKVVSQAIELNEQLERLLRRHDTFLAGWGVSIRNHIDHEQAEEEKEEEEEAEQLFQRMRKGKACLRPEDEDHNTNRPFGLMRTSSPAALNRPLILASPVELHQERTRPLSIDSKQEILMPLSVNFRKEANAGTLTGTIPPPPGKHAERERFFQENKTDGPVLNGHLRSLSSHSQNASSSRSGSLDFSD